MTVFHKQCYSNKCMHVIISWAAIDILSQIEHTYDILCSALYDIIHCSHFSFVSTREVSFTCTSLIELSKISTASTHYLHHDLSDILHAYVGYNRADNMNKLFIQRKIDVDRTKGAEDDIFNYTSDLPELEPITSAYWLGWMIKSHSCPCIHTVVLSMWSTQQHGLNTMDFCRQKALECTVQEHCFWTHIAAWDGHIMGNVHCIYVYHRIIKRVKNCWFWSTRYDSFYQPICIHGKLSVSYHGGCKSNSVNVIHW